MEAVTVRESGSLRVAAIGDLHCPRTSPQELRELFQDLGSEADVLLLCGDLTDYGKPDEARVLVEQLSQLRPMPVLAVLGNHEFECGKQDEIARILSDAGVTVLDGTAVEVLGIGFAGVKDRKSTRLNSSHPSISYAVFCLKKKKQKQQKTKKIENNIK